MKEDERRKVRGTHELGNWSVNPPKGYPRFHSGPHRNRYVHRVVWETVSGTSLPDGWHVHHQDFDRTHFCSYNLIAMPQEFNPGNMLRCPYTGQYLSVDAYKKRMGLVDYHLDEVPF
jgi:hypothetical protein